MKKRFLHFKFLTIPASNFLIIRRSSKHLPKATPSLEPAFRYIGSLIAIYPAKVTCQQKEAWYVRLISVYSDTEHASPVNHYK